MDYASLRWLKYPGNYLQVLIRGTFLEGLTLAIRSVMLLLLLYFVQLRIAKVKPSRKVPLISTSADVKNGDIASNVAMAGARAFHKAPRQIAEAITAKLQLDGSLFDRFEVAGPGFINLFLGRGLVHQRRARRCRQP